MAKILFTDFFGVIVQDSAVEWMKERDILQYKKDIFPLGDIGDIDEEEIFKRMSKLCNLPSQDIYNDFEKLAVLNERTVKMLRAIKQKGIKIIVLSNCYNGVVERRIKQFHIEDIFDDTIISYKLHMIKPNKDIYEYAQKNYTNDGDEIYYMDDQEANLKAPRELGWHTFLFNNELDESFIDN